MCELCEKQEKAGGYWNREEYGRGLLTDPMPGTCGGTVVWGFYYVNEANYKDHVARLKKIEANAKTAMNTLLIATVAPTKPVVRLLEECEWKPLMDYSTRYGKRVEGSLQVWAKEIILHK